MSDPLRPEVTALELLLRRLDAPQRLRPDDVARFGELPGEPLIHPQGWEVCAQGRALEAPRLVASGFLAETRLLRDGRRQIFALRLPGDVLGLTGQPQPFAVVALTQARTVDAGGVFQALQDPSPRFDPLRAAWARQRVQDDARIVDQVLRLGRLSAYERTAHLLAELHERLLAVGLASPFAFRLPLTQETLADLLGLSVVHVNRTLQELRRAGVIDYGGGRVTVPDRQRLAAAAGCAPGEPRPADPPMRPAQAVK